MAKYRFEQIAINSTEKKKPVEEDRFTYLGLEHLDSGSLKVSRFGSNVAPIGEKLVMRKGDVLFGKRRAYQKKVAIAPFDGIFSAHGMVLRPNVKVIDPDFFPLFISSDYFLDAAIKISVGSLSPTINWRDLKILEFDLPDLETQRKLAAVLWSINDTMESYKKLISATDELVKSQFIEMFGDDSCPKYAIKDVFMLQMGKTPPRKELELWDNGIYKWISIADIGKYGKYTGDTSEKLSQKAVTATGIKIVPENTVLMSFKLTVGKTVITSEPVYTNEAIMAFINKNKVDVNIDYLRYWLAFYNWAKDSNNAVCGITLNKEIIGNTLIDIPNIELQNRFGDFVQQADKSKFDALRCSNLNLWGSSVISKAIPKA